MDPKSVLGGPKPILRTEIPPTPLFTNFLPPYLGNKMLITIVCILASFVMSSMDPLKNFSVLRTNINYLVSRIFRSPDQVQKRYRGDQKWCHFCLPFLALLPKG